MEAFFLLNPGRVLGLVPSGISASDILAIAPLYASDTLRFLTLIRALDSVYLERQKQDKSALRKPMPR